MDKEKQKRLNLNLEILFKNMKPYEIELAKNYIESFEEQGYDVDYFKDKIGLIKFEKNLFRKEKSEIIKSFNETFQLN
jgi:hypothetical protein